MIDEPIPQGDKTQLKYLRNRYAYLLDQKMELDESIVGTKYAGKDLSKLIGVYGKLKEEMLHVDDVRTSTVLTAKNKSIL